MRAAAAVAARALHGLGLALWLGGLIAIGALVAPTAFHVLRAARALAGQPAVQTALAGGVVGGSLRVFNVVSLIYAVLMLLGNGLLLGVERPRPAARRATIALLVLVAVLLGSLLYLSHVLFPAMDAAQAAGRMVQFDVMHHTYEDISWAQMMGLLVAVLLTAVRDTVRIASGASGQ